MIAAVRALGIVPGRVLEPTCGSGAFLAAAATAFPAAQIVGVEYQCDRFAPALDALRRERFNVDVRFTNAYELDFGQLAWRGAGPLLVVGNPPWVTAAALGRAPAGDVVQPPRGNPKRLRGLAARTGAANFDVAEFLILKLLRELAGAPLHLALLVKESVARNVLAAAGDGAAIVTAAEIVRVDARRWFGVAVDACCLMLSTAPSPARAVAAAVVRPDFGSAPVGVAALQTPEPAARSVVFRQGVKHDAADVFELRRADGGWHNGYGDRVDVEAEHLYPLLKARALHRGEPPGATALVVPQQRLGAPTDALAASAPRLWRYLCAHDARIAARRSSIYRNAPRFAFFGIGPYSFAPWKVAVAGFYEQPRFRLIGPLAGRPVLFGDTAYFAAFAGEADAHAFAALCGDPRTLAALADRIRRGKRPITKALLDGIDWRALARAASADRLLTLLGESAPV